VCAQDAVPTRALTVQVGGATVGTRSTLNLVSANGIVETCADNAASNRVDCTPSYNSALISTHDTSHANENYCNSTIGITAYTCRLPFKALVAYRAGMTFLLNTDVTCDSTCSVNIDGNGPTSIKRIDGVTSPGGALISGQPQWIFYDGTVFRLMGTASSGRDRERDVIGRRMIASMDTMAYAATMLLEVTAGDLHKTITANAVGNAAINAATGGLAGQHMWIIIVNDQISAKTITFGANFKSSGALTGATGKSATIHFISDGTAWYEVARTLNL